MPLKWEIQPGDRLVFVKTSGEVTLTDVEAYLDDLVTKDAMAYGKLFDASEIVPVADDHDIMMLGARMRAYAQTMGGGPLAFVVTTPRAREIVDRYINLAQANRPVGVFFTQDEAKAWLLKQPR
jgi:hypothetical protein